MDGNFDFQSNLEHKQMCGFIHYDQIAEKLEIARTIGILTDYFIGPSGQWPDTSVRVQRTPNVCDEAVRDYLIRLLHGFVSENQIIILPMAAPGRIEASAGRPFRLPPDYPKGSRAINPPSVRQGPRLDRVLSRMLTHAQHLVDVLNPPKIILFAS